MGVKLNFFGRAMEGNSLELSLKVIPFIGMDFFTDTEPY